MRQTGGASNMGMRRKSRLDKSRKSRRDKKSRLDKSRQKSRLDLTKGLSMLEHWTASFAPPRDANVCPSPRRARSLFFDDCLMRYSAGHCRAWDRPQFGEITEFTNKILLGCGEEAESRLANRRVGSSQKGNLERLRSGDVTGKGRIWELPCKWGNFYECYSVTTGSGLGR